MIFHIDIYFFLALLEDMYISFLKSLIRINGITENQLNMVQIFLDDI